MTARAAAVALTLAASSACHTAVPAAATCQPVGRWAVAWTSLDGEVDLYAVEREFTVEVDATGATADRWIDLRGLSDDHARVGVDRRRCVASLDLATEFAFADDAGDRREHLRLRLDLAGDGGAVRGTLELEEVGPDPEDRRVDVAGEVRRIVEAPE